MVQPLHLVGFPQLNRFFTTETDTELAVYCSSNAMSGYLSTILLSMEINPLSQETLLSEIATKFIYSKIKYRFSFAPKNKNCRIMMAKYM